MDSKPRKSGSLTSSSSLSSSSSSSSSSSGGGCSVSSDFDSSILEDILTEKKLSLMKSPLVLNYIQKCMKSDSSKH